VSEDKARVSQMPHLYDVFEMPKIKALRAVTNLRFKLNMKEAMKIPNIKTIRTANKDIVKFVLRRGAYLLLFPGGYVEVHAPDEESMRSVLLAFREKLFENGLIK
jgi:hypothetical protein